MNLLISALGGVRATIFACLFLIASIAFGVSHLQFKAYKTATIATQAKAERVARATEEGWRKGIDTAVRELIKKRKARETELEGTINNLRKHKPSLVVRKRLTCPAASPADPSGIGGSGERGFSTDDAEFLLRVGARANKVRDERNACLAILKEERQVDVD